MAATTVARFPELLPATASDDALTLVAIFGLGAAVFLVFALLVEAAIALRGWLASYTDSEESHGN